MNNQENTKNVKALGVQRYTIGWNKDDKGWWYSPDGMAYYKEEWRLIKGEYYYFNKDGYALSGEWFQSPISKKWYYLEKDTCKMLSNRWILDKEKWYRLGEGGAMLTGWFQDTNGKWSYLDLDKGYAYRNTTILIDGKYYTFDNSCYWIKDNDSLVTDSLVEFIKSYEGFFANKYKCPAGVWTIGYGTTKTEYVNLGTCTKEQATQWLKEEVEAMAKQIKKDLDNKKITLKQNEFDALCSFAYNCGTSALLGSTLYRRICQGVRDSSLKDNFTAWSNANGQRLQGLYNRRIEEYDMFAYSDYKRNL